MKHQGKIFEKAIRNSKISISEVARQAKLTNRHFYNLFEYEEISPKLFIKIGKIIGHDFSIEVPELTSFLMFSNSEDFTINQTQYQQKYLQLLEKHIALIEEFERLKEKNNVAPSASIAPEVRQKNKVK